MKYKAFPNLLIKNFISSVDVWHISNIVINKLFELITVSLYINKLGKIQYNRGDEVTKEVLNEQKWHANVFQKDSRYSHQQEYRFAFSNFTFNEIGFDHLDLVLGDCSDIIKILT